MSCKKHVWSNWIVYNAKLLSGGKSLITYVRYCAICKNPNYKKEEK
jgi:hypothetical protein